MKQKWIAAVFVLCLCLLAACGPQSQPLAEGEKAISVYYMNKEETKITPEEKILDTTAETKDQVEQLLMWLGETPENLSLRAPVAGYEICGWQVKDKLLTLDVNDAYKKIQPTTEVLIRAALVRTLTQAAGVESVVITVSGETLTDNLGVTVGPMKAETFIDNAGNEINAYEKVRLHLYFANETGDALVSVTTQPVIYNSNISQEKLVVDQLIRGPGIDMEDACPMINPETKVLGVIVKDGVCYVNLDSAFLQQSYEVTGEVVIYSIVNSLVELPNVNKVQFMINGESDLIFREFFDLKNTYERNLDLVSGK